MYQNLQFTKDNAFITATVGGSEICIPAVAGNRHYDEIITQGLTIQDYQGSSPTSDMVRAECERRILLVANADKQRNLTRRRMDLLKMEIAGDDMTDYMAEITGIDNTFAEIDRLRDVSNSSVMEPDPPADYDNDSYWNAPA